MLQLELSRKLGNTIRAKGRSEADADDGALERWMSLEDPLVASVFGTLAYLRPEVGIAPLLDQATIVSGDRGPVVQRGELVEVTLWPNIAHEGFKIEPDGLFEFEHAVVLLEAKGIDRGQGLQQLEKYVAAARARYDKSVALLVVGLGFAHRRAFSVGTGLQQPATLLYASWRDVLACIGNQADQQIPLHEQRALKDIARVLETRSIVPYSLDQLCETSTVASGMADTLSAWFASAPSVAGRFWTDELLEPVAPWALGNWFSNKKETRKSR